MLFLLCLLCISLVFGISNDTLPLLCPKGVAPVDITTSGSFPANSNYTYTYAPNFSCDIQLTTNSTGYQYYFKAYIISDNDTAVNIFDALNTTINGWGMGSANGFISWNSAIGQTIQIRASSQSNLTSLFSISWYATKINFTETDAEKMTVVENQGQLIQFSDFSFDVPMIISGNNSVRLLTSGADKLHNTEIFVYAGDATVDSSRFLGTALTLIQNPQYIIDYPSVTIMRIQENVHNGFFLVKAATDCRDYTSYTISTDFNRRIIMNPGSGKAAVFLYFPDLPFISTPRFASGSTRLDWYVGPDVYGSAWIASYSTSVNLEHQQIPSLGNTIVVSGDSASFYIDTTSNAGSLATYTPGYNYVFVTPGYFQPSSSFIYQSNSWTYDLVSQGTFSVNPVFVSIEKKLSATINDNTYWLRNGTSLVVNGTKLVLTYDGNGYDSGALAVISIYDDQHPLQVCCFSQGLSGFHGLLIIFSLYFLH